MVAGAWYFSTVLVIEVAEPLRSVLEDVYSCLGVSWEPATAGCVADVRPGTTVAEVEAVLSRPGARIADVGCGVGWSTLALAEAYPESRVVGLDVDAPSVETARASVAAAGLTDRVEVHLTGGEELAELTGGGLDAVFCFECLHDMARFMPTFAAYDAVVRVALPSLSHAGAYHPSALCRRSLCPPGAYPPRPQRVPGA